MIAPLRSIRRRQGGRTRRPCGCARLSRVQADRKHARAWFPDPSSGAQRKVAVAAADDQLQKAIAHLYDSGLRAPFSAAPLAHSLPGETLEASSSLPWTAPTVSSGPGGMPMCAGDDHNCPQFDLHRKQLLDELDSERRSFLKGARLLHRKTQRSGSNARSTA